MTSQTKPKQPEQITPPPPAEETAAAAPSTTDPEDAPSGQPITRSLFIRPDYEKIATSLPTMFILAGDGEGVKEVPTPDSVKATGIVPEGYCVDFVVDPDTVVATLAKQRITNTSQLEPGKLEELIETLNNPENLKICPKSIYDGKRAFTLSVLEEQQTKRTKKSKQKGRSAPLPAKTRKFKPLTRRRK